MPNEFDTGDAVVYRNNQDDTSIGGLVDGTTYFVSVDAVDQGLVRLHATRADALAGINAIDIAPLADPEDRHSLAAERTFNPAAAVDNAANTIEVGNFAGLADGDAVKYFNGGGDNVGGLADGGLYFVNVDDADPNAFRIRLFETRADALAGTDAIDLDITDTTGSEHVVAKVVDAYHERDFAVDPVADVNDTDNVFTRFDDDLDNGDSVIYHSRGDDETIGALVDGDTYFVRIFTNDDGDKVMSLHPTRDDAKDNTNAIDLAPTADADVLHVLEPALTRSICPRWTATTDTIDFSAARGPRRRGGGVSQRRRRQHRRAGGRYGLLRQEDDRSDKIMLLNTPDGDDIVDLDASVASGTGHRLERVLTDGWKLPELRLSGAAAVAASVGRPVSDASIGAGATIVANTVGVTASMQFIGDAEADARAIGGIASFGVAAAGNYTEGEHIAEIGDGATVTADSISLVALGEQGVPYDYTADAASNAFSLGGNLVGSATVNAMRNLTAVRIGDDATVTVDGRLDLLTNLERDGGGGFVDLNRIQSRGNAGEAAFNLLAAAGAALAGTVTLDGDRNEASIGEGTVVNAPGGVDVRATTNHDFENRAIGGSLSLVFAAAAGAAFTAADTETVAEVAGSVNASAGDLNVVATTDVDYAPEALGLAAGGAIAIGFAGEANFVANTTRAGISGTGTIDADAVNVRAADTSSFDVDPGALAVSRVGAAGVAIGVNKVSNAVEAFVTGATVTTDTGGIDVSARSTLDVHADGIGFAIGGVVGAFGTFTFNSLDTVTRATVDGGAQLVSATDVSVMARDNSFVDADAGGLAVSFGLVGAGLSFASSRVTSDVEALIDGETTRVDAAGALTVRAILEPIVRASAVGFSASEFVAASGGVAIAETGGEARAAITGKATVTTGSVLVRGVATPELHATAGGLAGATFAAAGVMIAETLAGQSAFAEATGTITTGQLDVEANATRNGDADANFFGIAAFTGAVGFEAEHATGDTEAVIGEDADITITSGGDMNVSAVSNEILDPNIVNLAIGAFTIGGQAASAMSESNTRASVSGRARARNANVSASSNKTADATTNILNWNILSLNGVLLENIAGKLPGDLGIPLEIPFDTVATATIGGDTEAFLGKGADVTTTGTLGLTAESTNLANSNNLSAGATFVAVTQTASHATVGGSTQIHIDEGAAIDVEALTSTAFADNDATAGADYAGASGFNIEFGDVVAKTDHLVAAYLGPAKGDAASGEPTTTLIVDGGGLNLSATSENEARIGQISIDASLLTVEAIKPEADAGGATRAHVGGAFDIFADGVDATALSTNDARSNAFGFDLNLVDIDVTERSAHTSHVTEAFAGPSADLAIIGGALTLTATSENDANVDQITPIDVGVVDLNFVKSTADAGGSTSAYVAEGSTIDADGLTANAAANNTADVDRFQFGASVFDLQKAQPTARTTHAVAAYVGPAAGAEPAGTAGTITLDDDLALNATSVNEATVGDINISVDVVSVDLVKPEINAGGTTRVHVGGDYTVNASGVTGAASSTNTAGSNTVPIKIGLVTVGEVTTEVRTTHETEAFVTRDADFDVNGGGIELDAMSRNRTELDRFEFGASLVGVDTFKPMLDTAGATRAFVEEGAAIGAGSLSLDAAAANTASTESDIVTVGLVSFKTSRPTVQTTHVVDAYVGPRAGAAANGAAGSINVGGALTINAGQVDSGNTASLDSVSFSAGLVNGDSVRPDVVVGGQTLAHLGGNFTINAGTVDVTASSLANTASSAAFSLDVGLVNAGGGTTPVRVAHETSAYVADGSRPQRDRRTTRLPRGGRRRRHGRELQRRRRCGERGVARRRGHGRGCNPGVHRRQRGARRGRRVPDRALERHRRRRRAVLRRCQPLRQAVAYADGHDRAHGRDVRRGRRDGRRGQRVDGVRARRDRGRRRRDGELRRHFHRQRDADRTRAGHRQVVRGRHRRERCAGADGDRDADERRARVHPRRRPRGGRQRRSDGGDDRRHPGLLRLRLADHRDRQRVRERDREQPRERQGDRRRRRRLRERTAQVERHAHGGHDRLREPGRTDPAGGQLRGARGGDQHRPVGHRRRLGRFRRGAGGACDGQGDADDRSGDRQRRVDAERRQRHRARRVGPRRGRRQCQLVRRGLRPGRGRGERHQGRRRPSTPTSTPATTIDADGLGDGRGARARRAGARRPRRHVHAGPGDDR